MQLHAALLSGWIVSGLKCVHRLAFGHTSLHENTSLVRAARFVWIMHEPTDWGDVLDAVAREEGVSHMGWRRAAAASSTSGLYGGVVLNGTVLPGSGAIIFALRHWMLRTHSETLARYARVVITRADHFYACDHPNFWPAPGTVGVTEGRLSSVFGGVTDRHNIFLSSVKEEALNVLGWMVVHPTLTVGASPEVVLERAWQAASLSTALVARTMFTVVAPGDTTRWQQPSTARVREAPFLKLKYVHEHDIARDRCSLASGQTMLLRSSCGSMCSTCCQGGPHRQDVLCANTEGLPGPFEAKQQTICSCPEEKGLERGGRSTLEPTCLDSTH